MHSQNNPILHLRNNRYKKVNKNKAIIMQYILKGDLPLHLSTKDLVNLLENFFIPERALFIDEIKQTIANNTHYKCTQVLLTFFNKNISSLNANIIKRANEFLDLYAKKFPDIAEKKPETESQICTLL